MTTRLSFFTEVLGIAAWPITAPALQALVAVAVGEGSQAQWNPIDSILYEVGATPFNSFGPNNRWHVWNYDSQSSGTVATWKTLLGWPLVGPLLASGAASAQLICKAIDESDGVGGDLYEACLPEVQASWPALGEIIVAGSGDSPPSPPPTGDVNMILAKASGTEGPWYLIGGPPPGKTALSVAELAAYSNLLPAISIKSNADLAWLEAIPTIPATP